MSLRTVLTIAVLCVTPWSWPQAGEANICSRSSPAYTVALVELFTSEGCSSCPPADRWLKALPTRYGPDRLLRLALHVDYWDYIGWQDPYAQAQFAERQRLLGRLSRSASIYTPAVFAGMRELRDWRAPGALDRRVQEINRQPARAAITLAMRGTGPREAEIEAVLTLPTPKPATRRLQGVLVLYENQLVSEVPRGENRGTTLHHDHVVRHWSPRELDAGAERQQWRSVVKIPRGWTAAQLGVAVFIQDAGSGEVLQAVAMPACL